MATLALLDEVDRPRVRLFGIDLDVLRMDQAIARLLVWIREQDGRCRYVVTPNVDHVVLYQECEELRQAYEAAGLVLADGAPVVAASRLLGRPLPERVAGSDLVPRLFSEAEWQRTGLRVYLLGGAPGVGQRAANSMAAAWPGVEVVGIASPPPGFERDAVFNDDLVAEINSLEPDALLVGLGAPKQELWIHRHHQQLTVPVALCIGATIDFLAGERTRAPRWMRRAGLEWLFRVLGEPRRLGRRYARDAWRFPQILWREILKGDDNKEPSVNPREMRRAIRGDCFARLDRSPRRLFLFQILTELLQAALEKPSHGGASSAHRLGDFGQ